MNMSVRRYFRRGLGAAALLAILLTSQHSLAADRYVPFDGAPTTWHDGFAFCCIRRLDGHDRFDFGAVGIRSDLFGRGGLRGRIVRGRLVRGHLAGCWFFFDRRLAARASHRGLARRLVLCVLARSAPTSIRYSAGLASPS